MSLSYYISMVTLAYASHDQNQIAKKQHKIESLNFVKMGQNHVQSDSEKMLQIFSNCLGPLYYI